MKVLPLCRNLVARLSCLSGLILSAITKLSQCFWTFRQRVSWVRLPQHPGRTRGRKSTTGLKYLIFAIYSGKKLSAGSVHVKVSSHSIFELLLLLYSKQNLQVRVPGELILKRWTTKCLLVLVLVPGLETPKMTSTKKKLVRLALGYMGTTARLIQG